MNRWLTVAGSAVVALLLVATGNAAEELVTPQQGELWVEVEIGKGKTGTGPALEGYFDLAVDGSGIEAIALKHTSLGTPVMLLSKNIAGFDSLDLERDSSWAELLGIFPDGSYKILVKQDGVIVQNPFFVDLDLVPSTPNITNPAHGQVVDTPPLVVTWDSVPPGVEFIGLGLESWQVGGVELYVDLDPTETSFQIPTALLQPGRTYELCVEFGVSGVGLGYFSEHCIEFSTAAP